MVSDKADLLLGFSHIELYVGNPLQAAYYYSHAFGFDLVGYSGLETGCRDRASYLLRQGDIWIVLTSGLESQSPIAEFVRRHGEGVRDVALSVSDIDRALERAVQKGARVLREPFSESYQEGKIVRATIAGCGDLVHSFVERRNCGSGLPGYTACAPNDRCRLPIVGLERIDHVAIGVSQKSLERWSEFYSEILNLEQTNTLYTTSARSGMKSRVVADPGRRITFPLVSPLSGIGKSQVAEFLEFNKGPGVQHVAFRTNDILGTVRSLQNRQLECVTVPATYYDRLGENLRRINEPIDLLRASNIVIDSDSDGYLMQVFSKPQQPVPTFFVELIQRKGTETFGLGNIQALFEAFEREQALRSQVTQNSIPI